MTPHVRFSWSGHRWKANVRRRPGARSQAMWTASTRKVADPHIGSISEQLPSHPATSNNPAATASFNGLFTWTGRQPRRCRLSPLRSRSTVARSRLTTTRIGTSGSAVSMFGREPLWERIRSTMASLTTNAANRESRARLSRTAADTASVLLGSMTGRQSKLRTES